MKFPLIRRISPHLQLCFQVLRPPIHHEQQKVKTWRWGTGPQERWMVYVMDNPKWMMTGGTIDGTCI